MSISRCGFSNPEFAPGDQIIWGSDGEPDDRRTFDLTVFLKPKEIAFFGASLLHAGLKKSLQEKLVSQLGLGSVPVFQGSGGNPEDYGNVLGSHGQKVKSVIAATTYTREGHGILSDADIERIRKQPHSSKELENAFYETLSKAHDKSIHILMIAPPTDLAKVLTDYPELKSKIKRIYIMGGWNKITLDNGTKELRTTYNWDMDPVASAKLMKMCNNIPTTLMGTRLIRKAFGGAINKKNFPDLIKKIEECTPHLPFLQDADKAIKSWNSQVLDKIPALRPIIGEDADHQYTSADVATGVCLIASNFIVETKRITVDIDPTNQTDRGSLVVVKDDPSSEISLVKKVDLEVFRKVMMTAYDLHMQRQQL